MIKKKELEQALRLTDEMILIQGIVLIEQGVNLIKWCETEQNLSTLINIQELIQELVENNCKLNEEYKSIYLELSTVAN